MHQDRTSQGVCNRQDAAQEKKGMQDLSRGFESKSKSGSHFCSHYDEKQPHSHTGLFMFLVCEANSNTINVKYLLSVTTTALWLLSVLSKRSFVSE